MVSIGLFLLFLIVLQSEDLNRYSMTSNEQPSGQAVFLIYFSKIVFFRKILIDI